MQHCKLTSLRSLLNILLFTLYKQIIRKKGMFRGTELLTKATVPLAPLLQSCSTEVPAPFVNDARREIGGHMEVSIITFLVLFITHMVVLCSSHMLLLCVHRCLVLVC
jgi:hypothetical protein